MGFKCGIIGLPNVGKSTIFNALTSSQQAASENYPFCTIDPNVGIVEIKDPRLAVLSKIVNTKKTIPTSMEFVDIAGLVRGASKGEGLGNKFLGHIRSTQAVAHVVRCFEDDDVTHVEGGVNPLRDIDIIESELVLSDFETLETALTRYRKLAKTPKKDLKDVLAVVTMLEALQTHMQGIKPARTFNLAPYTGDFAEVANAYRDMHLITAKKVVYVCNVSEEYADGTRDNELTLQVKKRAQEDHSGVVIMSGKIESELSVLNDSDREEMMKALSLEECGLDRLARKGYETLGLATYFTAGEKETRAWTIRQGAKAPEAAGVIHSDFERGFICAEVYSIPDMVKSGSKARLKELGLLKIEGKEYLVKDGDVMEFRFNV